MTWRFTPVILPSDALKLMLRLSSPGIGPADQVHSRWLVLNPHAYILHLKDCTDQNVSPCLENIVFMCVAVCVPLLLICLFYLWFSWLIMCYFLFPVRMCPPSLSFLCFSSVFISSCHHTRCSACWSTVTSRFINEWLNWLSVVWSYFCVHALGCTVFWCVFYRSSFVCVCVCMILNKAFE